MSALPNILLLVEKKFSYWSGPKVVVRFIEFWVTFQSQWQQSFCSHFRQFFKVVEIFHFASEKIFGPLL